MPAQWYYTAHKQQMGPVSWDELRQLASSGLLKPSDLVWTDGMVEWVKASRQTGLLESDDAATGIAAKSRRNDETESKKSGRYEDEDEDEDKEQRRSKKRKPAAQGMAVGLKIALILGGVFFLLIILSCGIAGIVWTMRVGAGGPVVAGIAGGGVDNFSVNLNPGAFHERHIHFRQGQRITITVTSTTTLPRTDVDLFVHRGNNALISFDASIGPNSRVEFVAPASENFRVRVTNLGPGNATSRVNITTN